MPEIQTLGAAIAAEMGDGWQVCPKDAGYSHGVWISGKDSRRLFIRTEKGKLTVYGDYPADRPRPNRPHIGVSATKTPAQIAADITRRLLPVYDVELKEALAYQQEQLAQKERTAALQERLIDILPGAHAVNGDGIWLPGDDKHHFYGDARVSDNRVYLDRMSLSGELAVAVFTAIAQYFDKET